MTTAAAMAVERGRVGGYVTAARYGKGLAVARGRASVEKRYAGAADPYAAMQAQMARVRAAKAQRQADKARWG